MEIGKSINTLIWDSVYSVHNSVDYSLWVGVSASTRHSVWIIDSVNDIIWDSIPNTGVQNMIQYV